MRPAFALALLVFLAAAPAPQSLMPTPPKMDPERQCAAVLFADSGDVVVSSGKRCEEAVRDVRQECLKENPASVCNDTPHIAERSWVVIFVCERPAKLPMLFFLAGDDRTKLPARSEKEANEQGFEINECTGLMTFHSSEDK